ncbi:hypothetical protein ACER0A_003090 [Haloimpatiens sp. FM7315]|uniref:hypothetical protein n=1 Tax=Haloimpatiens sp. FM7315 TaxID=3298609 RepID=UPI0035A395BB
MKKLFFLVIVFVLLLTMGISMYSSQKNSYIKHAVEKYCTTGIFNKHKLYSINNWEVEFSDGNMAIVSVYGLQYKSPHDYISYKILLEKNKNGIWKLKKYYEENEKEENP